MLNNLEGPHSRLSDRQVAAQPPRVAEARLGPSVLHALLAQIPVGVLVTDRKGRIVYENDFARNVLANGATIERVSADGAGYSGFHRDGSPYQKMEWPMARALLLGEVVRDEEIDFLSPDGSRRWLSVSASPVRVVPSRIDAVVATCTDVTSLKRAASWQPIIESLQRL
jgi:PAS domain S-box-containing protein